MPSTLFVDGFVLQIKIYKKRQFQFGQSLFCLVYSQLFTKHWGFVDSSKVEHLLINILFTGGQIGFCKES